MSPAERLSLVDAKNHLSEVVDRLEREHGRVVITKHGQPTIVMLSGRGRKSVGGRRGGCWGGRR